MQRRSFRPFIFMPVNKWGVGKRDWKYIWAGVLSAFFVPLILGIRIKGFPIAYPLSILTLLGLVGFFNYVRSQKKPMAFEHELSCLFREILGTGQNLICTTSQKKRKIFKWIPDYSEKQRGKNDAN